MRSIDESASSNPHGHSTMHGAQTGKADDSRHRKILETLRKGSGSDLLPTLSRHGRLVGKRFPASKKSSWNRDSSEFQIIIYNLNCLATLHSSLVIECKKLIVGETRFALAITSLPPNPSARQRLGMHWHGPCASSRWGPRSDPFVACTHERLHTLFRIPCRPHPGPTSGLAAMAAYWAGTAGFARIFPGTPRRASA